MFRAHRTTFGFSRGTSQSSRLLLLGVSLVVLSAAPEAQCADQNELLSSVVIKSGAIAPQYDALISRVTTSLMAESDADSPVSVDRPYTPNQINLYIIDPDKLNTAQKQPIPAWSQKLLAHATNNAISLPPNLIILDANYLSTIIANVYSNQLSWAHFLDKLERLPDQEIESEGTKFGALEDFNLFRRNTA
jgi:hypothetical protein